MKKIVTLLLATLMVLALAGCTKKAEPEPQPEPEPAPDTSVMTYAEYAALPADGSAEVVIESNVQAAQSYWDGGASLYLQDEDGAYFVYAGQMSEEDKTNDHRRMLVIGAMYTIMERCGLPGGPALSAPLRE